MPNAVCENVSHHSSLERLNGSAAMLDLADDSG